MNKISVFCLCLVFLVAAITGTLNLLGGIGVILGGGAPISPELDSEFRCLAVFWLAFGIFCLWVIRNMQERKKFIPAIAVVLFISGVARLLSLLMVGIPENSLVVVMIVEMVLPVIMMVSYKYSRSFSEKLATE